uniref:Uncharacterized protein n=1 Tax=Ananas comosus var. bracteatus TaxID=296719 RepID=A0A6V7P475_ANACO|nr:unnamed protein product [Ananas comosus var. bracteatus]
MGDAGDRGVPERDRDPALLGGVSGGDEFLEQMLAAAPSAAWCDHMAEDPSPPPPQVATRYTPYDPIGGAGAAAAPASSAAELGLFAPAIGDGAARSTHPPPSNHSIPPAVKGSMLVDSVGFFRSSRTENVNELRNHTYQCRGDGANDGAKAASEGEERPSNGSPQHR